MKTTRLIAPPPPDARFIRGRLVTHTMDHTFRDGTTRQVPCIANEYAERDGRICRLTPRGWEALTNFAARIVRQEKLEGRYRLRIEVTLEGGERRTVEVDSRRYRAMGWVARQVGPEARIFAGRDHVRCAIQHLSSPVPEHGVTTP
jgi:hypothetical protein